MVGGFQYLAGKVGEIRKREGEDKVLLLDAGDTFSDDYVGNQTRGEAIITLMNALGYDMMALGRSEEHTSELQSLMRISYAVFCLKKKNTIQKVIQED